MWRLCSVITAVTIARASPIQNGESEQSELEQSVSPLSYAVDEIINPGQPQGLQGADNIKIFNIDGNIEDFMKIVKIKNIVEVTSMQPVLILNSTFSSLVVPAARVMAEVTEMPDTDSDSDSDSEQVQAIHQLPPIQLLEKPDPSSDPTNVLANIVDSYNQQSQSANQGLELPSPEPSTQLLQPSTGLLDQPDQSTVPLSQLPKPARQFSIIETKPLNERIVLPAQFPHASQVAGISRPRRKRHIVNEETLPDQMTDKSVLKQILTWKYAYDTIDKENYKGDVRRKRQADEQAQIALLDHMTDKAVLKRVLAWKHAYDTMNNVQDNQQVERQQRTAPTEQMDGRYILRQVEDLLDMAKQKAGKSRQSPYEEYLSLVNGAKEKDDSQLKSLNADVSVDSIHLASNIKEADQRVHELKEELIKSELVLAEAKLKEQQDINKAAGVTEAPKAENVTANIISNGADYIQQVNDVSPPNTPLSPIPLLEVVTLSPQQHIPTEPAAAPGIDNSNTVPATMQIKEVIDVSVPNLENTAPLTSPIESNRVGGLSPQVESSAILPDNQEKILQPRVTPFRSPTNTEPNPPEEADNVAAVAPEMTNNSANDLETPANTAIIEDDYDEEDYTNSLENYDMLGNNHAQNDDNSDNDTDSMAPGLAMKPTVIKNDNDDHVKVIIHKVGNVDSSEEDISETFSEELLADSFQGMDYAAQFEGAPEHTNIKDKLDDESYEYEDYLDKIYDWGQDDTIDRSPDLDGPKNQGKDGQETVKKMKLYQKRNNRQKTPPVPSRSRHKASEDAMSLDAVERANLADLDAAEKANLADLVDRIDFERSFINETGVPKEGTIGTAAIVTHLANHIREQMEYLRSTLKLLNMRFENEKLKK